MKTMSIDEYLENCGENALVPYNAAASILGINIDTMKRQAKSGKFEILNIKYEDPTTGITKKSRGVSSGSVTRVITDNNNSCDLVREILHEIAAKGETIFYGELLEQVGKTSKSPPDRAWIGGTLDLISRSELEDPQGHACEEFLLSALVVNKKTGKPSQPFFSLAMDVGLLGDDEDEELFWEEQVELIHQCFEQL